MKTKSLLSILKSNDFAIWIAILSVIVQSFHSYTAFYNTSSLKGTSWGMGQAVLFSIVIDSAILFYTVRNRKDIALWAAVIMSIINVYYYYQHLGLLSLEFYFGCFLSLIIPTSVYFYSEEIKDPAKVVEYDVEGMAKEIDEKDAIIMLMKKDKENDSIVHKQMLENIFDLRSVIDKLTQHDNPPKDKSLLGVTEDKIFNKPFEPINTGGMSGDE